MKTGIILVGIRSFFFFPGCSKSHEDKYCITSESLVLISITGPASGTVNTDNVFDVKFAISNGCGASQGLQATQSGNTVTIAALVRYIGCTCTAICGEQIEQYKFNTAGPGTYTLKFRSGTNNYIDKTILIN